MARAILLPVAALLVLILTPAAVGQPSKIVINFIFRGAVRVFNRLFWRWLKDKAVDELFNQGGRGDKQQQLGGPATSFGPIVFNLSVGTPPATAQNISGVLDITSQLVWAQCAPCSNCSPPIFQPPGNGGSFSKVPCAGQICQRVLNYSASECASNGQDCAYNATYGEATYTTGYLATDTFNFDATPVPNIIFGCSNDVKEGDFLGSSGVIGFGRGFLSLVSQLALSRFSYYVPLDDSTDDDVVIMLGDAVPEPDTKKRTHSTPLLNSSMNPDLYYVKLTGIKVDGVLLNDIPAGTFDLRADGSGGVFLSTTTPATFLEQAAYDAVKNNIQSRINAQPANGSALGLGLCYKSTANVTVPLTLVFDGADMDLAAGNYFLAVDADKDNATELQCLTILPSPAGGGSVLGSLIQRGRTMIYDLDGKMLTFKTGAAAPPSQAQASMRVMLMMISLVVWVLLL